MANPEHLELLNQGVEQWNELREKNRNVIPDLSSTNLSDTNLITFHKSLVNNPIKFYSCFISYSHQDKSFTRRTHDQLQMQGVRCWLDEKQMLPGDASTSR